MGFMLISQGACSDTDCTFGNPIKTLLSITPSAFKQVFMMAPNGNEKIKLRSCVVLSSTFGPAGFLFGSSCGSIVNYTILRGSGYGR